MSVFRADIKEIYFICASELRLGHKRTSDIPALRMARTAFHAASGQMACSQASHELSIGCVIHSDLLQFIIHDTANDSPLSEKDFEFSVSDVDSRQLEEYRELNLGDVKWINSTRAMDKFHALTGPLHVMLQEKGLRFVVPEMGEIYMQHLIGHWIEAADSLNEPNLAKREMRLRPIGLKLV